MDTALTVLGFAVYSALLLLIGLAKGAQSGYKLGVQDCQNVLDKYVKENSK